MKRTNELIVGLAVMAVIIVITWGLFAVGDNMPAGATPFSRDVYELHNLVLGIVTVIGVLVFSAMFTSIYLHRKSRGHEASKFTHSTVAESIWTAIPILILVGMAIPATTVLVDMEDTGGADMNVKITGYQWLWRYDYLDDDISIYSAMDRDSNRARQIGSGINPADVPNYLLEVDNRLVLPTDTRIRFLLTADDVIHSWWVPELGWKRDAIPGMVNEAWTEIEEPGIYRGQCAELCGKDHGFMPIVVEAVTPEEYREWVEGQTEQAAVEREDTDRLWTRAELVEHGREVYDAQCASCHAGDGSGMEPAFPALAGSPVATGGVDEHLDVVVHGRPGTAMAAFGQRLSASDIAAAVTYTRNAFGNDTGDLVQPAQVRNRLEPQGTLELSAASKSAESRSTDQG